MAASLRVEIAETATSQANNTSTVRVKVIVDSTSSWNLMSPDGSITFGGNLSGTETFSGNFETYSSTVLYDKTFTVTHNGDGTGTVTASATFDTEVSSGVITASATKVLKTIPRASKPSVDGTFQLGSAITVMTNRQSDNFTHTLKWAWAGRSGTIGTGIETYVYWAPTIATFAPYLTTATSDTCVITCETYNGSTHVGTQTCEFELRIPASVQPSITSISVMDLNGYLATYGAYIQDKSSVKVETACLGAYGSTVEIAVTMDGVTKTGSNAELGAPGYTGERRITVEVLDSRGRIVRATRTIQVAPYIKPTIASAQAYRYDTSAGAEDDEASTIRVHATGGAGNINGANQNACTVAVSWREHLTGTWMQAFSQNYGTSFDVTVDIPDKPETQRYDVRITATDSFGTVASTELEVMSAKPVVDFKADGEGLALFGIADREGIKVGKDVILGQLCRLLGTNYDLTDVVLMALGEDGVVRVIPGNNASLEIGSVVNLTQNAILANGRWLYAKTTSGTMYGLFSMGTDNVLQMQWPNGGVRGNVRKTIWTGNWSSGQVTVPDAMKYNIFIAHVNSSSFTFRLIGIRQNAGGMGSLLEFYGLGLDDAANTWSAAVRIASLDDISTLQYVGAKTIKHTASAVHAEAYNLTITKIEGVL